MHFLAIIVAPLVLFLFVVWFGARGVLITVGVVIAVPVVFAAAVWLANPKSFSQKQHEGWCRDAAPNSQYHQSFC